MLDKSDLTPMLLTDAVFKDKGDVTKVLLVFRIRIVLKGSSVGRLGHFLGTVVTVASLSIVAIKVGVLKVSSQSSKVVQVGFLIRVGTVSIAVPVVDGSPLVQTVRVLDRVRMAKVIAELSSVGKVSIGSSVARVTRQDDLLLGLLIY